MDERNPRAIYAERIKALEAGLRPTKKSGRVYIAAKLLSFVLGLLGFSRYLSARPALAFALLGGFTAVFAAAALLHEKILRRAAFDNLLLRVNREELRALDGEFLTAAFHGPEDGDPAHPYASDLDLFGEHSLFHFLNRAATGPGRRALAGALLGPRPSPSIPAKQEAVRELSGRLDFRQRIRALALAADDDPVRDVNFARIGNHETFLLGKRGLPVLLVALPLLTLAALAAVPFGLPLAPFAGLVLVQVLINKAGARRIEGLHGEAARRHRVLSAYADIIGAIEAEEFRAPRLWSLRERFLSDGPSASRAIRGLSALLGWMNARSSGVWHALLNCTILWDLQGAWRIERWNARSAGLVPGWLEALGEMECLAGLANCAFNHPTWAFPLIRDDVFTFKATGLGHPLIPDSERVVNDFTVAAAGAIDVLTGPNMAGKSTFLRTIGVNAVLAFAGGAVCARSLEISSFGLITSMKSSDSLDKRMSLFYAELLRLKLILDEIREGRPSFFLIDEMLRGTNALDRHKGAEAMIRQLLKAGATGIVATHDLELTALAEKDPRIVNHHFDSAIEGGTLVFDFKIKPGVCRSFNALVLMKSIGLDI